MERGGVVLSYAKINDNDSWEIETVKRRDSHKMRTSRCKRNGRIDGKKGIPEANGISPFEEELLAEANEKLRRLDERIENQNNKENKKRVRKQEKYRGKKAYFEKMVKMYEEKLNSFNTRHKDIDDNLSKVSKDSNVAKDFISVPWWFWLIFCTMAIAEFPLNSRAFKIFGGGEIETDIMAVTICLSIPLSAHWFGKNYQIEKTGRISSICILLITIFLIGTFYGISYLRGEYNFSNVASDTSLLTNASDDNVIRDIISEAEFSESEDKDNDDKRLKIAVIGILFVLNSFIFLVIAWTSYYAHTLSNNNVNEYKQIRESKRNFRKTKKYYSQLKRNQKKDEMKLSKAKKVLNRMESLIQKPADQGQPDNIAFTTTNKQSKKKIMENLKKMVAIYRKENLRTRDKINELKDFNIVYDETTDIIKFEVLNI